MLYAYNQAITSNNHGHSPSIPFIWDNDNYLVKMKTDTDFLKEHELSKWFNFGDKNDPFLVIPACAHSGVGLKGLKKARKRQAKSKATDDDSKYEVPLDNSLMQRIKASEVVLEKETKGTLSEASFSPQTNKSIHSPTKSEKKLNQPNGHIRVEAENQHPNHDGAKEVGKRESLFDLRKKNQNNSSKSLADSNPTPKHVSDKQVVEEKVAETEPTPIKEVEMEEEKEDETFDYELFPLGLNEKEAVAYLEKYQLKLDDEFSKSYAPPQTLFDNSMNGNNAQWYGLRNKGSRAEIDGLFIYNLDFHFNRVNILHLTTISRKGLDDAVTLAMNHIWGHENAKECRIGLYHFDGEKNGKTIKTVDNELREALKKHKLRWKNMLNEANARILVMGGNRPNDSDEVKNDLEDVLSIKAALLYSVTTTDSRSACINRNASMFFLPSLYLNSLMQSPIRSYDEEDESIEKHHRGLLDILTEIKNSTKERFPFTVSNITEDVSKAIEPATANGVTLDHTKIDSESKEYHCNAVVVEGKLLSIDYCTHSVASQDYKYLRIKCKEMICVKAPSVKSEIFFMPIGSHHNFGLLLFKKPKDVTFENSVELYNY